MTLVVVLVKSFEGAKTRLGPALGGGGRRALAKRYAGLAMRAAGKGALVVTSSAEVAAMASRHGLEAILEAAPAGQNPAARVGIEEALRRGASSVLLLSSDLPLVRRPVIKAMLERGAGLASPAALAAPATGRGGTNALFLKPPGAIGLHFGDDSLAAFESDARSHGVRFELFEAPELAFDVDEPDDLERLTAVG